MEQVKYKRVLMATQLKSNWKSSRAYMYFNSEIRENKLHCNNVYLLISLSDSKLSLEIVH